MRKNTLFLLLNIFIVSAHVYAQSGLDSVLSQISRNNKNIIAAKQLLEAEKLKFKTGISLYDPTVEYDYMKGTPSSAGNQHEWNVNQSFDFPTAYVKKKNLSESQAEQSDIRVKALVQDILFKAKSICIEIVYREKMQTLLNDYAERSEQLQSDFQKKLDMGDGNVLDLNKARMMHFEVSKDLAENSISLLQLNQRLTELNGGAAIFFSDTMYVNEPPIEKFEQLEKQYEESDPIRRILEKEMQITKLEVEVARSMRLPKFEVGYHYQGILGADFSGIHTGLSLPLWEDRNKVKYRKAQNQYSELELQAHRNEHFHEIKNLYDKYISLRTMLTEYRDVMSNSNNSALLSKALTLGHISSIEYFLEMTLFRTSMKSYLELEMDYHLTLAKLYKYQL